MAAGIESILLILYGFYNTVFHPILAMGPYVALGFFSTVLAGLFSLIYWYMLDIERADEIKEKLSEHQEKMKEARQNEESEKASEHMQKTMKLNQKLMKLNMQPMIGTMIFVALIFPWLGATFAPTVELTQTGADTFSGNMTYANQPVGITVDNSTSPATVTVNGETTEVGGIVNAYGTEWNVMKFGTTGGGILSTAKPNSLKLNAKFVQLPFSIPLAGEELNWLGFYILIAMPLTFLFRKMLGVA